MVITEATNNLVGGRFAVESLGGFQMKGVTEPVVLYRVREATGVRNRLNSIGLTTPFVGRAAELKVLTEHWSRAARGHGQVVVIHGEPGIGKSRLVQQFSSTLQAEPDMWIEGFCLPFSTDTPFAPVIEGLERGFVKATTSPLPPPWRASGATCSHHAAPGCRAARDCGDAQSAVAAGSDSAATLPDQKRNALWRPS